MTSGRMYILMSVWLSDCVCLLSICPTVCLSVCLFVAAAVVVRIVKLRSKTQETKHATRCQLGDAVANQQHHESNPTAN